MIVLIMKILIACAAIAVIIMVIDNMRFVVRRYRIRTSKVRYPVRLVFIADLHEKSYGKDNEKLVDAIRKVNPDAVLAGGDLIVSGAVQRHYRKMQKNFSEHEGSRYVESTDWMKHSLSLMKRLSEICPVWFVQGNHELRLSYYDEFRDYNETFTREMEKAGVRFLHNGSVDPAAESHGGSPSGIALHGLELPMEYYRKFKKTVMPKGEPAGMLGRADRKSYTILMSHMPVYFKNYADWGADLCLCGHVHGGLMRLPVIGGVMGTRPNLFPKYSGGQYFCCAKTGIRKHLSSMIVTCGLGMHTLPIRIFNPGEVSVVEIFPTDIRQEE